MKAIADRLLALQAQLESRGLRYTNTAGNFLRREYHAPSERRKLWENAYNANAVARRMGWRLQALDRDVQQPLPFPDGAFDRVFSICVLEHLPSALRQLLMGEIGRALAPGSIAGFTTDYDEARPVLLTDKGLRFAYKAKLERDVLRPSGPALYGAADWTDACPDDLFLGTFFLHKPSPAA